MRTLLFTLLLAASLAAPARAEEPSTRSPELRSRIEAMRRRHELPPGLKRLEGRHRVDDRRLRQQFDQAVGVLIELQKREIEVDVELMRELRNRRVQRREPAGQYGRPINTIEPSHIPSVEVIRAPLT